METIPECELGNKLEQHEGNRKFLSKFGLDALKVRPCEWYQDEFKYCRTLKAKFRDFYVLGYRSDCEQWKVDYKNCMEFRKYKTIEPFENVLKSERKRIEERSTASKNNDVWKYRTEPPKDFCDLDQIPRSSGYSPFEVYEHIKETRKKKLPNDRHKVEDTFVI